MEGAAGMLMDTILKRKIMIRFIGAIVFFFILLIPRAAGSAGMGIAGSTWFVWWKPYWEVKKSQLIFKDTFTIKPGFISGPALQFYLPKNVSLSTSVLYGEFSSKRKTYSYTAPAFGPTYLPFDIYRNSSSTKRIDSDTTILYAINRFFSIFLGFKYSHIDYKDWFYLTYTSAFMYDRKKRIINEYAPALGFGVAIPLVPHVFFMIIKASVLFNVMMPDVRQWHLLLYTKGTGVIYPENETFVYYRIGLNSTLNLAYFISAINTTITIGFRYQMLKMLQSDPFEINGETPLSVLYDHFYGITAGVLYRIDFPGTGEGGSGPSG